jgi:hypothetical protein
MKWLEDTCEGLLHKELMLFENEFNMKKISNKNVKDGFKYNYKTPGVYIEEISKRRKK